MDMVIEMDENKVGIFKEIPNVMGLMVQGIDIFEGKPFVPKNLFKRFWYWITNKEIQIGELVVERKDIGDVAFDVTVNYREIGKPPQFYPFLQPVYVGNDEGMKLRMNFQRKGEGMCGIRGYTIGSFSGSKGSSSSESQTKR